MELANTELCTDSKIYIAVCNYVWNNQTKASLAFPILDPWNIYPIIVLSHKLLIIYDCFDVTYQVYDCCFAIILANKKENGRIKII